MFKFGKTSRERMKGVHPELCEIMEMSIKRTPIDFGITQGVRSLETQKKYVKLGKSKTLKSMHLPQDDGFSWAFDIHGFIDGEICWERPIYDQIFTTIFATAKELGYKLRWGGAWHLDNCIDHYPDLSCHDMTEEYVSLRKSQKRSWFLDLVHVERSRV